MRKVYVDVTEFVGQSVGVIVGGAEVILTGTTVYSMSKNQMNEEYKRFAEEYDIHFIFDDEIPKIDFYTIPLIDIMATDSMGGFIGTIGNQSDLHSNACICYISKNRECFIIARNATEFLNGISTWKKNMKPYDKVVFYHSKEEAANEIVFYEVPRNLIDG